MIQRSSVAALALLFALGLGSSAQATGVGIGFKLPTGDFGDLYDGGFGFDAVFQYPVTPLVVAYGDIGYTKFTGKEVGGFGVEDIDVWNFSAGARTGLGPFYVGGELGYYTEIDEFSLSPLVGTGLGPLDVSARYKLTGDVHWFDLRASIAFPM